MGGKGSDSTTTTSVSEPWDQQKPFLSYGFQNTLGLYGNGGLAPDYYSGQTVAAQDPYTIAATNMQAQRALDGSQFIDNAQAGMDNIIGGNALANNTGLNTLNGYAGQDINAGNAGLQALNGLTDYDVNAGNPGLTTLAAMTNYDNPYMDALYAKANGAAQAGIDSSFNAAGRYGSGAMANAKADAAQNLANEMYGAAYDKQMNAAQAASNAYLSGIGQNATNATQAASAYNAGIGQQVNAASNAANAYNTGIGQQIQAATPAQQLANQAYTDAAALAEAGYANEDYKQQLINADIDRYNYNAQQPLTALSNYMNLINGSYGGTNTMTGQQATNGSAIGNIVGGGLAGYGASSLLGTSPLWGTGIGAGLGGLLSLL